MGGHRRSEAEAGSYESVRGEETRREALRLEETRREALRLEIQTLDGGVDPNSKTRTWYPGAGDPMVLAELGSEIF
jgi:hypothetical protein